MFEAIERMLAAHPYVRSVLWSLFFFCVIAPLIGAWVNWVTYKRTPEEWARYQSEHPYRAVAIRISRLAFPHLRKFFPAIAPLLPPPDGEGGSSTGDRPASTPPAPTSSNRLQRVRAMFAIAVVAIASLALLGCPPGARSPSAGSLDRDVARGAVMVIVEAADYADAACSSLALRAEYSTDVATVKRAIALARQCRLGKAAALDAARAASAAIKSWDAGARGELLCAGGRAAQALESVVDAIRSGGGQIPAEVEDGLSRARFVASFAGASCPVVKP